MSNSSFILTKLQHIILTFAIMFISARYEKNRSLSSTSVSYFKYNYLHLHNINTSNGTINTNYGSRNQTKIKT